MAKSRLGASCAAVALASTIVSAQTTPTPKATSDAAKAKTATISGCVVRDAANGGQATIASNGISYKLTGKRAQDFDQYLGKRVEVTGMLETGAADARATSGKAEETPVPKDQTAVGGQSDVPVTGASRDNTVEDTETAVPRDAIPLATDKGTTADLTGRMQVKTIRTIASSCL